MFNSSTILSISVVVLLYIPLIVKMTFFSSFLCDGMRYSPMWMEMMGIGQLRLGLDSWSHGTRTLNI